MAPDWALDQMKDEGKTREQLLADLAALRQRMAELEASQAERKLAEQALRESEERLRTAFEAAKNVAFVTTDLRGTEARILDFSPGAEAIFGYSREEVIGKPLAILHIPEDVRHFPVVTERTRRRRAGLTAELTLVRKSGERFPALVSTLPIFDADGNVVKILGVSIDITARKEAEEALRKSEEKYRSLVQNVPDMIYALGRNAHFTSVNEHGLELLGYEEGEFLGRHFTEVIHPDDVEMALQSFGRAVSTKEPTSAGLTLRVLSKDGRTIWVSLDASMTFDEKGEFVQEQGVIRDITAQRAAEEEIGRLTSAVRQSIDGIAMGDLEARLLYVNEAFARMHGYSTEEMIGMRVVDLHNDEQMDQYRKAMEQIKGQGSWEGEIGHARKDGTCFPTYMSVTLLRDDDGNPTGLLAVARDITARKEGQEKLLAYQEQLRSLASRLSATEERERRRIAAGLHDRVGQLLGISAMRLEKLKGAAPSPRLADDLDKVGKLIHEALEATQSLTFELSPPTLHELGVGAALKWFAEQMQKEHGIRITVSASGAGKAPDEEARALLYRATRELLLNVVKHADARNADVSLRRDGNGTRIRVEDDGRGFDLATMGSGWQANKGFGLFSIRERLERLGGSLKVQSEPGKGTQVTLTLPLRGRSKGAEGGAR